MAANASADPTTGNASIFACARANANHTSVNASAEAGFSILFQVPTSGSHVAFVDWTISYNLVRGCFSIYLFVINSTSGNVVGSGGSSTKCTGVVLVGSNASAFEGWNGSLMAHHAYFLETYLYSSVISVSTLSLHVTENALVTGTLDRVQLR